MLLLGVLGVGIAYERHHDKVTSGNTGAPKGGGPARGAGRAQVVVPATASAQDVPVYLAALGSVTPTASVTVRTRIDGQLLRVLFKEGQLVKEGDLLAEIDPRPYQVQLEQAQGQLARDEALLANARLDLERYQTLFAQDSVSKQTLDTQASLVRQYSGAVLSDRGAVNAARLNLVYSRITSPVTGRVGLRLVDPGNIVHAADATGIVIVNAIQPISVIFSVPGDRVPELQERLSAGQPLQVEAYDRTRTKLLSRGTLLTLDNQNDPSTGTVRLKALFENERFQLFPQQFVNTQLLLETLRGATVIPTAAVQHGVQGAFVYLITGNRTVRVQPVTTGPEYRDSTVISRGLAPGDRVVVEGADRLTDGASVTFREPEAAPAVGGAGGAGTSPPDGGR